MDTDTRALARPDVIIKFVELVVSCICLGLTSGNFWTDDVHKTEVVIGTFIGFTILGSVICISYFLGTPVHKKLLIVIAFVGAILFLTSGALALESYDKYRKLYALVNYSADRVLAAGIIALINCIIYCADIYLSYRS